MKPEDQKLYNELYRLREKYKIYTKSKDGRASTICTDDALIEIVRLKPKKLDDFKGVKGIGTTFIENYGNKFLEVILKYQEQNEIEIAMKPKVISTMKELEKKLVNINKKNRLLSLNNLTNKYAYDLCDVGDDLFDKIIFSNKSFEICNIDKPLNNSNIEDENIKYRKIVSLLRETNKDLREKGQNDLYIGFPFVIGRLPGENFDVHAPLVLFPVIAERTPTTIKLQIDEDRDVVYNNTLLLAYYKFNRINEPLPNDTVDDNNRESLIYNLINFYNEKGLHIKLSDSQLTKFSEYKMNEFPTFSNGELKMEMNAVLGKFPICSSSIQKDFDLMLEENKCNELVEGLLDDDLEDFYSDNYNGIEEKEIKDKNLIISERSITYINELNSSQEAVLNAIDKHDRIVIQGPPGTGKSQTIASLIADFVNKNKTVLMVSEKKTALDVVYSRLGKLSKYALLIDDVGNKNTFYSQLSNMVYLSNMNNSNDVNLEEISNNIDNQILKLEKIAQKLYAPCAFGIEPYKLYLMNKKYDKSNEKDVNIYTTFRNNWISKNNLLNAKYKDIEKTRVFFENDNILDNITTYIDLFRKYNFLDDIIDEIVGFEILDFLEELKNLRLIITAWSNKSFFARIFSKGKVKKQIKVIINKYFIRNYKVIYELLFKNIDLIIDGVTHLEKYKITKELYVKLDSIARDYASVVYDVSKLLDLNYQDVNQELFNALIYSQIEKFEKENIDVKSNISDFDNIIMKIAESMAEKQKLTKNKLEHILLTHLKELTSSKRQGEIRRAIESKRRWSVNKFINKFGFELFKSINIWLLTPEVVSEIIPLQAGIFDLVIFDEASQMYVEKGIPSILRGKKVVIAGDDKQLRPSNLGFGRTEIDLDELSENEEIDAALEEESLLDLARFKYIDILLNFHYRSKYEELIAFSNYAFYKGRLYVSPNTIKSTTPPIEVHKVEDGLWQNRANIVEARYIVDLLKKFFKERKNDETVGIITFNSNQRDLIDDLIDEACAVDMEFRAQILAEQNRKRDGEDIGLFVKNIESVQGDERDVIIFSIGYAKNEKGRVVTNFGWLNQKGGENRLNVAISRAKLKVHIVTSIIPNDLIVESAKNDGPRYFKKYLEYAYAVSNNDLEAAKQVLLSFGDQSDPGTIMHFDSDFENQVYDALIDKGFEVDTQVGIGGYRIDLAIKIKGRYVLGIECDGKLYHSSKSARERDIHRQKYLESRGWKIHRIWSPNWWNNRNREIEKICSIVSMLEQKDD